MIGSCFLTLLRRAASLPFFTRLRRGSHFSLRGQRESDLEKGHPTFAPCAQSLCSRSASLLRGSPTVHPWTDVELAHIVWAILRTIPSQPRRDRGDPIARIVRAKAKSPLIRPVGHLLPPCGRRKCQRNVEAAGNRLCLGCAGCAVNGPPMQRQRDAGIGRKVGAMDCAQFDASPGTDCRRTPAVALRSRKAGCLETAVSGWPSLWCLSLGHARERHSLAGGE